MNVIRRAFALSLLALATPLAAAEHGAQLVDQAWVKAMKANDLEATMALYAPEAGGDPIPMKGRATVVVKKIGAKWQYVVDLASVPIPAPPAK